MPNLKILLVDDDPFVREAIGATLKAILPGCLVHPADSLEMGIEALSNDWDLILVDISLGKRNGMQLIRQLRITDSKTPVLVISSQRQDQTALAAINAGASGYLCKDEAIDASNLEIAIETVRGGRTYLTEDLCKSILKTVPLSQNAETDSLSEQEKKVLFLIASGKAAKEIAAQMDISEKTVRTYRVRLLKKLGMNSDAEIVRYAMQNGIID